MNVNSAKSNICKIRVKRNISHIFQTSKLLGCLASGFGSAQKSAHKKTTIFNCSLCEWLITSHTLMDSFKNANTQWRHKSKKSEIFWPIVVDKYALVVIENLCVWCYSGPCSAGQFFIIHPSFVDLFIWYQDTWNFICSFILNTMYYNRFWT